MTRYVNPGTQTSFPIIQADHPITQKIDKH